MSWQDCWQPQVHCQVQEAKHGYDHLPLDSLFCFRVLGIVVPCKLQFFYQRGRSYQPLIYTLTNIKSRILNWRFSPELEHLFSMEGSRFSPPRERKRERSQEEKPDLKTKTWNRVMPGWKSNLVGWELLCPVLSGCCSFFHRQDEWSVTLLRLHS